MLVFDLLRPEHIAGIAWKFLDKIRTSAASRRHLTLEFGASASDSSVIQLVVEQMQAPGNMAYGGRRVKLLLETLVEKPLNRWIYEHQPPRAQLQAAISPSGQVWWMGIPGPGTPLHHVPRS